MSSSTPITRVRAAQALFRYAELMALSFRTGRDAHARQVLGQIAASYADSDWAARALLRKGAHV